MSVFQSLEEARAFFSHDLFATSNGMTLDALTEDGAVCGMPVTERHLNAEGGLMGGAILALADFTFAAAASSAHRPTVAQQVSLSFLNASKGTRLTSVATCSPVLNCKRRRASSARRLSRGSCGFTEPTPAAS